MLHTEIRKLLCGGGAGLIFQVGEAHLPGRDGYRQRKADEFAGIQFLLYKIFNHTGNPQIDFGEINEQIHGCDFYSLGGSDFFLYQIFFHVLPCDVLLIKQHQGGVRDGPDIAVCRRKHPGFPVPDENGIYPSCHSLR